MAKKSKARIQWPWFILYFCLAAVANTYVHTFNMFYPSLKHLGDSWLDRNALPDWNGPLKEDASRGRRSAAAAGNPSMDRCCRGVSVCSSVPDGFTFSGMIGCFHSI